MTSAPARQAAFDQQRDGDAEDLVGLMLKLVDPASQCRLAREEHLVVLIGSGLDGLVELRRSGYQTTFTRASFSCRLQIGRAHV